jgi:hypothetical protein
MVHSHRTAHKSTRRQPIGPIVPGDVSPQQESQHDSPKYVPQEEESIEIMVTVPVGEDTQEVAAEAQQLL